MRLVEILVREVGVVGRDQGYVIRIGEIDEARVFVAPMLVGGNRSRGALGGQGVEMIGAAPQALSQTVDKIDGDVLICTPGGDTATLVALNKTNGEVIWKTTVPGKAMGDGLKSNTAAYASAIVATVRSRSCGVRTG